MIYRVSWAAIPYTLERNEEKMAYFQGREAKVNRSPGKVEVYYGGFLSPDGIGHGHVKATGGPLGENIVYWRLPEDEGGKVIVDNSWDITGGNDLSNYLTNF